VEGGVGVEGIEGGDSGGGELACGVYVGVDEDCGGVELGVGALLGLLEGGEEPAPPTSPEASTQNDIKRLTWDRRQTGTLRRTVISLRCQFDTPSAQSYL